MIRRMTLAAAASACLAATVLAHTPLKKTVPENGSILSASPNSVSLEFAQAVRLTQLRVELPSAEEHSLEFSPKEASAKYSSAAPNLSPGRNAIHWTALSPDGHVIEGTIIVVIQPDS